MKVVYAKNSLGIIIFISVKIASVHVELIYFFKPSRG